MMSFSASRATTTVILFLGCLVSFNVDSVAGVFFYEIDCQVRNMPDRKFAQLESNKLSILSLVASLNPGYVVFLPDEDAPPVAGNSTRMLRGSSNDESVDAMEEFQHVVEENEGEEERNLLSSCPNNCNKKRNWEKCTKLGCSCSCGSRRERERERRLLIIEALSATQILLTEQTMTLEALNYCKGGLLGGLLTGCDVQCEITKVDE